MGAGPSGGGRLPTGGPCGRRFRGGGSREATGAAEAAAAPADIAEGPCLEVVPVPGKGLGTRAVRGASAGEVLLEEAALLRVAFPGHPLSEEEFAGCVRAAAEALSPEHQAELLGLACPGEESTVEGVFQVNHFEVDGACVVYRRISRLNHSCTPNCAHSFDRQRGVGMVRALRQLLPGEELSLTYTELRAPRAARRQYLQQVYGFTCTCEACRDDRAAALSDRRRQLLRGCCDALAPRGPIVQMHNFAGEAAEFGDEHVKGKLLAEALEARALGLCLAVLALQLVAEEALVGAGDAAGHVCEAAAFLLAGHAEAQALWADECLRYMSLGGSPTDDACMQRGLDNIRQLPALLPQLPADIAPEVLEPRKIAPRADEAAAAEEAGRSLRRLEELYDGSVAANAPG